MKSALAFSRERVLRGIEDRGRPLTWVVHSLAALTSRLEGRPERERTWLLSALGVAFPERAVLVSLARLEQGKGSVLEVMALEGVLNRSPGWTDGRLRLLRAYRNAGDTEAAERVLRDLRAGDSHEPPGDLAA